MRISMMRMGLGLCSLAVFGIAACDCGGNTVTNEDVGLPRADTGVVMGDSGNRNDTGGGVDAGGGTDRFTPNPDATVVNEDASAGDPDAQVEADAWTPPCDDDSLEDNDTADQATQLAPGSVQAQICANDEDWYAVTANANDTIAASITFTHTSGDLDLYLIEAPDVVIDRSESTADQEAVASTVTTAGTYYIIVVGYSGAQNPYTLNVSVETGPPPTCNDDSFEENDTQATATAVVAGTYNGQVCAGDPDFFVVSLNVGDEIVLDLSHTDDNLDLQVLDPSGAEAVGSTGTNQSEHAQYTATAAGAHAVRVYGFGADDESAYELVVVVNEINPTCRDDTFEENDDADHPAALSPGTFSGQVCASDEDWFGVTLAAGDEVEINLNFLHGHGNIDAELLLPDRQVFVTGTTLDNNEQLVGTAAQGGVYLLRVFGAEATVENDYELELIIRPSTTCSNDALEPNDSVAQAAVVSAGDYPAKICPGDEDWYSVTVNNGDTLGVSLTFSHSDGNVDLKLFDDSGQTLLGSSLSTTDNESLSHVAASSGVLLVQVVGALDVENDYAMALTVTPGSSACTDDGLEENDTPATATAVQPGTFNAHLCPGDDDWYQLALNAGDQVVVDLTFTHADGNIDTAVFDANGQVLGGAVSEDDNEHFEATVPVAGTYYMVVTGAADTVENSYGMELVVTPGTVTCRDDSLEENDTAATASAIGDGSFDATVCPGDDDFYSVNLNVGDTIDVSANFVTADGDLELQLLNPAGQMVDSSTTTNDEEAVNHEAVVAGQYIVRVYGYRYASNDYTLTLAVTPAIPICREDGYEENDSQEAAVPVVAGTLDGQVCAGDEDWFAVNLNVGDELDLHLAFTHEQGDLDLQLRLPSGAVLRSSSTSNDDEEILGYVAETAGAYGVRVRGWQNSENAYRLRVEIDPFVPVCNDDIYEDNDNQSQAPTIIPGSYDGLMICAGDEDWYGISLNAGDVLDFSIQFTHADGDLELYLRDASGALVASSRTNDDNEAIGPYEAPTAGMYYMAVVGHMLAENGYSGTVTVQSSSTCTDDGNEDNDTQATATAYPGSALSGQICASDADWISVVLNAGDTMTAQLTFSHADGDLDMSLYNPAGGLLRTAVTTTDNESIVYEAVDAGTYALRIAGYGDTENSYGLDVAIVSSSTCTDDSYEDNDDVASAVALPSNDFAAQVCNNDADFYSIDLVAGQTLIVDVLFVDADGDIDVRLHDAAGSVVLSATSGTDNERISFPVLLTGSYTLEVYGYRGAENSYSMQTSISEDMMCPADDALEQNDNFSEAATAVAGTAIGIICPGDDDYFKVAVPEGGLVRSELAFNGNEGDLDLYLYDAAQTRRAQSYLFNPEKVAWYSDTATDFYLLVQGYSGASASYALDISIEQSPFYTAGSPKGCPGDDGLSNNEVGDAVQLRTGEEVLGVICGEPYDWYAVALEAGDELAVDLAFANVVGDLDVVLFDPDGNFVSESSSTDSDNERLTYVTPAENPGVYFVFVAGWDGAENWYAISANVNPASGSCVNDPDEPNDSRPQALLTPPGLVGGQICEGDADYYQVNVGAGQTLVGTLMLEQEFGGDLELRLETDSAVIMESATTEDREIVTDTALGATTYYLVVEGFLGTHIGAYTLNVEVIAP